MSQSKFKFAVSLSHDGEKYALHATCDDNEDLDLEFKSGWRALRDAVLVSTCLVFAAWAHGAIVFRLDLGEDSP